LIFSLHLFVISRFILIYKFDEKVATLQINFLHMFFIYINKILINIRAEVYFIYLLTR